jgi:tRNA (guanine-N7-)-methyltransferase
VNIAEDTHSFAEIRAARKQAIHNFAQTTLHGVKEIVWEIGCGHGHFLTAYAATHPDRICVGIDLAGDRITRAVKKRDHAKLPNLAFVQAEARLFIESLPETIALSEIFVLFPDPWPKLRHHKHRIVQPGFLTLVARRAVPTCRLCFRTDFRPYFDEVTDTLRNHTEWRLTGEPWPFEFETVFQRRALHFHSLTARVHKQDGPEARRV